jgi:hypothetical protein
MKVFKPSFFMIVAILTAVHAWASDAGMVKPVHLAQVFTAPGIYDTPSHTCPLSLNISEMGGFKQLLLHTKLKSDKKVNDVTGLAYLSNNQLVYSVSPVYGIPGVYIYNCNSKTMKRISGPRKIDKAYPLGAEYFELYKVEKKKIFFFYGSDVDQIDFEKFRSEKFLRHVTIN